MSRVLGLQIRARQGGNGPSFFSNVPSHLPTHDLSYFRRQSSPNQPQPPPPSSSPSSSHRSSSSPTLLLVFVAVAAVVFASGLLHLLIRFLKKRRRGGGSADPSSGGGLRSPSAIQRQLQQLFTLHDGGGLDQASIDALPEFVYTELRSAAAAEGPPGEPLDCAVCLCEFSPSDRLRLLPACGHAFHLACIDAWLTSSSTCPLCRGAAISMGDAEFDLDDDWRDLEEAGGIAAGDDEEKVVFPVRLGKFRSVVQGGGGAVADVKQERHDNDTDSSNGGDITKDAGEAASSSCSWRRIDERRCYSMGSYQYVLQESALRLPLSICGQDGGRGPRRRVPVVSGAGVEGRRLSVVAKGESFSVSKIWQWANNKGQYPFPAVPSNAAPLDQQFTRDLQERTEGR